MKGRSVRLLIPLCAAAIAAGTYAGSALASHQHYANLWTHGCGDCTSNYPDGWIHPFLDSSDGTYRNSCVAWAENGVHGSVRCQISNHNHVDLTTAFEPQTSAHTESSQTGLAHHHHFPH